MIRVHAMRSLAVAVVVLTLRESALAAAPRATRSSTDDFNARAAQVFHREYFFHAWNESDHTVDGEDWSLPSAAAKAAYPIDEDHPPPAFLHVALRRFRFGRPNVAHRASVKFRKPTYP